jgi:hypothetical protein
MLLTHSLAKFSSSIPNNTVWMEVRPPIQQIVFDEQQASI